MASAGWSRTRSARSLNSSGAQNTSTYNIVPEPSTYALMATDLLGIFGVARRRQSSAA
ncbi:PEP-CTERM sorting domain-containing protein [Gemmatimonas sp.]|uniref:PEP-CTERM sorting domain-containing protein n=1 Tax=Gemmatimonas sp. TaxID=1962908 RepID=UPI0035633F55